MITIYSTDTCAYCPMVKRFFKAKNVPFIEEDITHDTVMRTALHKHTGYSTVPVTTDGETYVVGWKPGELAKLIKK